MKHIIRFETEIKNGQQIKRHYLDGEEMALFRISRRLTYTCRENDDGIFTTGIVMFKTKGNKEKTFVFEPSHSIQERINIVREYFTRDDKITFRELEVDDGEPEPEV